MRAEAFVAELRTIVRGVVREELTKDLGRFVRGIVQEELGRVLVTVPAPSLRGRKK